MLLLLEDLRWNSFCYSAFSDTLKLNFRVQIEEKKKKWLEKAHKGRQYIGSFFKGFCQASEQCYVPADILAGSTVSL